MSINKVILIGNVGKDPEVRHLEGGASVATITLATSERYKDRSGETKEITEWHNVVAWRQLADLAGNYIRKGTQIYVEGRIRTRSWDDQNGVKRYTTEILADTIQLLGRKADNPAGGSGYAPSQQGYQQGGNQQSGYQQGGYQQPAQQNYQQTPSQAQPAMQPQNPANDFSSDEGIDDLPF
ncbi:MAG: single-stranded DNA-binding protein [Bacteroidales bacterium]|nr:single-stranded DNA-binding protein [Bacteroidales bacterium]MDD4670324.1 single-stranded DNA-binding protein [Bacteroidales bacterium]